MQYRLLSILVFLLGLTFTCAEKDEMTTPDTPEPTIIDTVSVKYLALGDSYTIGTAVEEAERWPVQLAAALRQPGAANVSYEVNVDIIATNGWTTGELRNGIRQRQNLTNDHDLVSLLIGVNNQYRGQPLEGYKSDFEDLLQTAIRLASGDSSKVFVVSIPDYGYTPFGRGDRTISEELDRFNATANFIADDYGVPFLNITPISRQAEADTSLVASDDLHPSGKQYKRWIDEVILKEVRKYLAQ